MNCIIVLFLIVSILINEISTQDYCNLESCPNRSHTECKYNSAPAAACGDQTMIQTGLSSQQRDEIVNFHNDRRAFVASGKEQRGNPGPQPPATNMKSLMWDEEVASIAQTWADQCGSGHDQCRNVERFGVGQNIAYFAASDQFRNNLTSLMLSWYEEVKNLDNSQVKAFGTLHSDGVG
ncbi:venom allergen 3-like isoform X2 [Chelonus insularis]|uniref:venom allergen 3-like isoform X2 n=1 Tax=Chelonus insularis TaxID=460826 RepID=UPI00158B5594|nr:venom allergen 3-like isoform X2 [Chelonus insularis]